MVSKLLALGTRPAVKSCPGPAPSRPSPSSISAAVMVRGGIRRIALGFTPLNRTPASLALASTWPEMSSSNSIATSRPLPRTSLMNEKPGLKLVEPAHQMLLHGLDVIADTVLYEELGPGVGPPRWSGRCRRRSSRGRRGPGPCNVLWTRRPLWAHRSPGLWPRVITSGSNAVFLVAEQAAQTAQAGLHLVQDQQQAPARRTSLLPVSNSRRWV